MLDGLSFGTNKNLIPKGVELFSAPFIFCIIVIILVHFKYINNRKDDLKWILWNLLINKE